MIIKKSLNSTASIKFDIICKRSLRAYSRIQRRMVYLKGLLVIVLLHCCCLDILTAIQYAYKKPIYGKMNYIKDNRHYRPKTMLSKMMLPTTTTTTMPVKLETMQESELQELKDLSSHAADDDYVASIEKAVLEYAAVLPTLSEEDVTLSSNGAPIKIPFISSKTTPQEYETTCLSSTADVTTTKTTISATTPIITTPQPLEAPATLSTALYSNQPVSCTCGVFLSSQIHNGLKDQPLILNELDRIFPCNAIGRKQCQTKCLESIVQHLPNSANIVCATLGEDCHKERAYLFIKNCQNEWWNTNLQAGREYCCKDGQPYRCPLMG